MEQDQELIRLDLELKKAQKVLKAIKLRQKARNLELGRESIRPKSDALTAK